MISTLEVTNFQSWRSAVLEFCPGVNIIKGTSHHGKSSLVRALDWVFNNRPISDEMRPWSDEKKKLEVSAGVEFDKGQFLIRIKNKKFNGYNTSIGDLEALGRDIPTEIIQLANMQENLHRQDDGYFLLNESPGNVARVLNRKSGLEDIDIIQKATKGVLAELQSDLRRNEENRKEFQAEFDKLEKLSELKPLFDEIDKMIAERNEVKDTISKINKILLQIHLIDIQVKKLGAFILNEKEIKKISNLALEIREARNWWLALSFLSVSIDDCKKLIRQQELVLSNEERVTGISKMVQDCRETEKKYEGVEFLCHRIDSVSNFIKITDSRLFNYAIEMKELLNQKTETEKLLDYCPSCGAHKKYWRKQ